MSEGSVRSKAVRGVAWTIGTGLFTRLLQFVGNLVLTSYILGKDNGEVTNASIIAVTAHAFTSFGVPNYLVSRKTDRAANWHATVVLTVTGIVGLALVLLMHTPLAKWVNSPDLDRYLPWLVLSTFLMRIAVIPERLLQQRLQFREASGARAAGELAYTIVTLALAVGLEWGGMAIVGGNIARSVVAFIGMSRALSPREWITPHRYNRATVREIFSFGTPLGIGYGMGFAARNLDNLLISGLFGPAVSGPYGLAYNVADLPASQIGEQVGDVLTPSFVHVDDESRKRGLVRATGLLAFMVFPIAVGLALTAPPVISILVGKSWELVGPFVSILAGLSIVRPVSWTIGSYLQATQRSRTLLGLTVLNLAALAGCVWGFGKAFGPEKGPYAACIGVVAAGAVYMFGTAIAVAYHDKVPLTRLLGGALRPLLACVPLALAVLGVQYVLKVAGFSMETKATRLVGTGFEVVAGVLGYFVGVVIFARAMMRDLLELTKDLRRKRAQKSAGAVAEAAEGATDPTEVAETLTEIAKSAQPEGSVEAPGLAPAPPSVKAPKSVAGPRSAGPKSVAGPRSAGPKSAGPKSAPAPVSLPEPKGPPASVKLPERAPPSMPEPRVVPPKNVKASSNGAPEKERRGPASRRGHKGRKGRR